MSISNEFLSFKEDITVLLRIRQFVGFWLSSKYSWIKTQLLLEFCETGHFKLIKVVNNGHYFSYHEMNFRNEVKHISWHNEVLQTWTFDFRWPTYEYLFIAHCNQLCNYLPHLWSYSAMRSVIFVNHFLLMAIGNNLFDK